MTTKTLYVKSSASVDPDFAPVSLLLHCDGAKERGKVDWRIKATEALLAQRTEDAIRAKRRKRSDDPLSEFGPAATPEPVVSERDRAVGRAVMVLRHQVEDVRWGTQR